MGPSISGITNQPFHLVPKTVILGMKLNESMTDAVTPKTKLHAQTNS